MVLNEDHDRSLDNPDRPINYAAASVGFIFVNKVGSIDQGHRSVRRQRGPGFS